MQAYTTLPKVGAFCDGSARKFSICSHCNKFQGNIHNLLFHIDCMS